MANSVWLERGLARGDSRDYSPERVARERRKLADAQAASSSLPEPAFVAATASGRALAPPSSRPPERPERPEP